MFLRFTKGQYSPNNIMQYKKCVFLGNSLIMEYGNKIVGIARLHEESNNYFDYDVIVAKNCPLGSASIARYIKDMIGKSNKFSDKPTTKRRKYYVEEIDADVLPIKAEIKFLLNHKQ